MPWVAPWVGIVDPRGRLFCIECADKLAVENGDLVSGDLHFSIDDKCDGCGDQFVHVHSCDYVQVLA